MSKRIKREDLISDLEMVKGGVSPREFIEQSSCFVFNNGELMTFNDEVACRKPTVLDNISGAVQAASLTNILSKLQDDELEVEENDKGQLQFAGKRKRFAIVKDAEIFLPMDRVPKPEKWMKLSPEFSEAVDFVKHCVSKDENKFILTCIHIHPDYIEACDNFQHFRVSIQTGVSKPVLVRGQSLEHITKLAMIRIAVADTWLHFKNDEELIYSCRRYIEEYPNLDNILKVEGHKILIPKSLMDSTDRAAVFATDKEGDANVLVSLKDGLIRVRGEGLSGWYQEVKKTKYKGPPMSFLISPDLLRHISEKYTNALVSQKKLRVEGANWTYTTVLGSPKDKDEEE